MYQASSCSQTLFEDKGKLATKRAKNFQLSLHAFCHFSPPYSQNTRDNNYLNLNFEYKGKRGQILQQFLSNSKNVFFSAPSCQTKRGVKSVFVIWRLCLFLLFAVVLIAPHSVLQERLLLI